MADTVFPILSLRPIDAARRGLAAAKAMARQSPAPRPKPQAPRPKPQAPSPKLHRLRRPLLGLRYLVIAAIWGAVALGVVMLWFTWNMPNPALAVTTARRPAIRLLDPSGRLVARFGDASGRVVLPSQLPPYVPAAFIAIEDRRFYAHGPFDMQGILRAAMSDIVHRRIVQGGSTLTQQVAKTLFLTNQRSLRRKVQEAVLSLWLARHYSKQEILGIYLNRVYLGDGAYGVDAAARLYFGVPATQLTLAQAAILAGLPKAPSALNPLANPQAAANRATEVLTAMVATQAITPDQASAAEQNLADAASPISRTSWFALWVMQQAGDAIPQGQDATLETTLNAGLQTVAEAALNNAICYPRCRVKNRPGRGGGARCPYRRRCALWSAGWATGKAMTVPCSPDAKPARRSNPLSGSPACAPACRLTAWCWTRHSISVVITRMTMSGIIMARSP